MHGGAIKISPKTLPSKRERKAYHIQVIQEFSNFLEMKERWGELVAHSGELMLTIEHDWLHVWLKHFSASKKLFIITVLNARNQMVAVAPLQICRASSGLNRRLLRHLQFIGTEPCLYDEMKIVIRQGEDENHIIQLIAEEIKKRCQQWDVLDLRYAPDHSQLASLLHCLKPLLSQGDIVSTMSCPFMNLPIDIKTYEQSYPSNAKKLRQQLKKISNAGFGQPVMQILQSPLEIHHHLEILSQWHTQYWQSRGSRSNFQRYPKLRNFYSDLLTLHRGERPKARFFALRVDDDVLAYDIGLQRKNGYLGHLGAYNLEYSRFSPGFLLDEMLLQYGISQGDRCYYLGRGNEPHKARWQNDEQPLWNLLAFRNSWIWQLWQMDDRLRAARNKLLRR